MGSTFFSKRYKPGSGRYRKARAKTFKTEDDAKKFAAEKGLKDAKVVKKVYSSKYYLA